MGDDALETWDFLIENANPASLTYRRLVRYRDQVARGVFLSPKAYRFRDECLKKFDNIECDGLVSDGMCSRIIGKGKCDQAENYRLCSFYKEKRPEKPGVTYWRRR